MFFSRLFFLLLTLISIFIQSPLTHAMEEGDVSSEQILRKSSSATLGDQTASDILNSITSKLSQLKTGNASLKNALAQLSHQQIIKKIIATNNELMQIIDHSIEQVSADNLSENDSKNLKKIKSDFNQLKYDATTALKKPLLNLHTALLPGAWKEQLKFVAEKNVNLDQTISNFYNHQLYLANYAALIYLNLILQDENKINEIRTMDKNIADKKLKANAIKDAQEYAVQFAELNAAKKEVEDKRKRFKNLLKYLEDALDFGSLAKKYLAHYKQKVDDNLNKDHNKLTMGFSNVLLSIDPEVLEKDAEKNQAKREQWKQKTRTWLEYLQKSPRRSQTSQHFKKQSKQIRKESKAEEK